MYQITEAVDHMHQNKVAHRDIKPANIVVTLENRNSPFDSGVMVKIVDFGMSIKERSKSRVHTHSKIRMEDAFSRNMTVQHFNTHVGTEGYQAPEVFAPERLGMKGHRFECDWFSVGVTLCAMLSALPAFWKHRTKKHTYPNGEEVKIPYPIEEQIFAHDPV